MLTDYVNMEHMKNAIVKLKKNRELGVLTSGIKRDGHQKETGN